LQAACRAIQNVNASWRESNLKNSVVRGEVCRPHLKCFQRCAKSGERPIYALGVADIGLDQDIHVLGCARMAMERYCVPTHEDKLRACIGQLEE
jgi:hypothetical protein